MFGGFGVKPASQLNEFLEFDQYTFQWQKSNWSGDIPKQGLYGNTMQVYKNSFIIFGGAESQSNVTNQTLICNIPTKYVQQIRTIGDIPDPRKNHVAFTMGKSMLIHGGKNMRKQALDDLWNLDLNSQKWMKIQQDNQINSEQIQNIYPIGVSYHRAIAVFHPERKNIGLFKGSEKSYRNKNLIKKEGIYFYGGLDNEQNIIDDLLLLKLENNQHNIAQWEKIQTEGKNPGKIYSHSMEFIQNQGLIIIYGGVKQISDSHQEMTDEIYILELSNLNWIKGVYKGGIQAGPRQNHLSFVIDNQMYIFGGINIQGFVSNETFRLELKRRYNKIRTNKVIRNGKTERISEI
ncbi:Galactose oxidase/kelch, beta-propeller [Pseudocohnilembus persalinus]|uniref:Galactose oxidase/kelch, beta-propeller n=1 Tax=Pseudocohnilembus persalinus TaxID=266149 RepID=A0A0V0QK29_PSEPJ|nr:Galactose oxidase/kelch, beta-propeller [Pseudocohnilembus persalinus]|eukprot:KRX02384.1 Galactose oxidase/kelch, beta-propeller [Pseudocohnilembus persalinus]